MVPESSVPVLVCSTAETLGVMGVDSLDEEAAAISAAVELAASALILTFALLGCCRYMVPATAPIAARTKMATQTTVGTMLRFFAGA